MTYRTNRKYILLALGVILLYLAPLYIWGQDAHVLILDNVDGAVAAVKVLAESGQIFGGMDATISQVMNGLPRNTFGTEFNLQVLLYWALPPFMAYVANLTLMHLIAFAGMLLLLRRHILPEKKHEFIAVGVALAFALLPFWPFGGLSVAGQPLVLYAFLNIRAKNDRPLDWLILALVPFYSSLVFSFAFFLFLMGLWWLYDVIVGRKIDTRWLSALIFMGLVYMLVEYRLIYNTFFDAGFVSIRSEFPLSRIHSLSTALKTCIINFFYGQFHAASLQQLVIIPSVALALLVAGFKRKIPALLVGLLFLTGIISLWYGFWFYDGWIPVKQQVGFLREFNFSRFHWLHPLLWYLIFALALKIIAGKNRAGKVLVSLLLVVQIGFVFYHNDGIAERRAGSPTYREFYAEEQFRDIKAYIGRDEQDYRVVSIGIHPSISQYNGFYTLDGYASNYPLAYKHEFRKIIAPELDKSPFYRDYFDALGGSRCYIFVEKLMYNSMMKKDAGIKIEKLDIDTVQLKKMGGEYVFSALEIINAPDIGLKLQKVFDDDHSAWRIYLYEVL
ncbi:MAG: DUF6044 family protein [Syntrophomonas sp.]